MTSQRSLARDVIFGFLDAHHPAPRREHPRLIANEGSDTMLRAIKHELSRSERFTFSVAFVTPWAVAALKQALLDFAGTGTIVTSTYLGFNSPNAFAELANLPGVEVLVLDGASEGFHAKGYVFHQRERTTAIVGSSNLTQAALLSNHEWNLRFSAMPGGDIVGQLERLVERQIERAVPLTKEWLTAYEAAWTPPSQRAITVEMPRQGHPQGAAEALPEIPPSMAENFYEAEEAAPGRAGAARRAATPEPPPLVANQMQQEALEALDLLRSDGARRGIVISATGTGKTILGALDVRNVQPQRLLFVVHREEIIDRAREEFHRVLGGSPTDYGKAVGGRLELDTKYVFASIQTLSRRLNEIDPQAFDYVLIDEVHRAGAKQYQALIDYLQPKFLLGMTATPERTDGFNIYELFDYNVAYEIRLHDALENGMLAPFHYYGVTDYIDADGEMVEEVSDLKRLVSQERVTHLLRAIAIYGQTGVPIRGLMFCSRVEEAQELERLLNESSIRGHRLRTRALTGSVSVDEREKGIKQLEAGELDYLITVDVFNEGVDIPTVNQVVMLRQTTSSIVFTQQLGRGLRLAPRKEYLVVIDFIGNYANNFLIPIALFGDSSLRKDSVRQQMGEAQEGGTVAGISTVNFDPIARDQVFKALDDVRLDSMTNIREAYREVRHRVGQIPKLYDFARFDTVDPVVFFNPERKSDRSSREKNYWSLLVKWKEVTSAPSPDEAAMLNLLTAEMLNGKRPQEALILQALIERGPLNVEQLSEMLKSWNVRADSDTLDSALALLDGTFANKVSYLPAVSHDTAGHVELTPKFQRALSNELFLGHVQDIIETSLYLARHRHGWDKGMIVGQRYSRKDVCRLLNWLRNEESTIYGYKVDRTTGTCPIFVTYHKDEEVSATTAYDDELLDEETMRWFSRSRRTLRSGEIAAILSGELELHVFVKRDDAEGTDFVYLGPATPSDARDETMPDGKGGEVDVVTMNLKLEHRLEQSLYEYLTEAPHRGQLDVAPITELAFAEGTILVPDGLYGTKRVPDLGFDARPGAHQTLGR